MSEFGNADKRRIGQPAGIELDNAANPVCFPDGRRDPIVSLSRLNGEHLGTPGSAGSLRR